MRWPKPQPLPCLVKPLSRRAFRIPTWPVMINRLVSAIALPIVQVVSRNQPLKEEVEVVRRFDARADRLWERLSPRFALAVRRDARYLNWKFIEPPHVRYTIALLRRGDEVDGYVVYRHLREPQGRVTQIVDLLADPSDERGIKTLARWVDREARAGRLGQDSLPRHQRGVPPRAAAFGVFRREVGHRSYGEGQRGAGAARLLRHRPTSGISRSATAISITRLKSSKFNQFKV